MGILLECHWRAMGDSNARPLVPECKSGVEKGIKQGLRQVSLTYFFQ